MNICGARIELEAAERQIRRQAEVITELSARLRVAGLPFQIGENDKAALGTEETK